MRLETEALLFSQKQTWKRTNFKSTLFSEYSVKSRRHLQVYGLLPHRVWVLLEANPDVLEYNESPLPVQIPCGTEIFAHIFRFAARYRDGGVEVIDTESDEEELNEEVPIEASERRLALGNWCSSQDLRYRSISRSELRQDAIRIDNYYHMLKFVETADPARDVALEARLDMAIAHSAPTPIRQLIDQFPGEDKVLCIAHLARRLLNRTLSAPIDRRPFDGNLLIDC